MRNQPAGGSASDQVQYGLILPHFGSHALATRLVDGSRALEQMGFNSVWVRDHVIYRPHAFEDPNTTFIEPITVLSAIAAVTENLVLGTAVLTPHRHPILMAQELASLNMLSGGGRMIIGWGRGAFDEEFRAVGISTSRRSALLDEQIAVMRAVWGAEPASFDGEFYSFSNVQVGPAPQPGAIPFWNAGNSVAAAKRAALSFDGWLASRIPARYFGERIQMVRELSADRDAAVDVGVVCLVSPASTVEAGARAFDVANLCAETNRLFSENFHSIEELDGVAIPGPGGVIAEKVREYEDHGARHVIFDLRARFADWEDCVRILAEDTLPALRGGSAS